MAKRAAASGPVEGPWELPEGWRWERLGAVARVTAGQSPPSAQVNSIAEGLPFFQGKAEFGLEQPKARKWCPTPSKIAEAGDVLVSVRAPVGPTNFAPERCGIGRGLASIRSEALSQRYLHYWLQATEHILKEKATGTTFEAITCDVLRQHMLPIPPNGSDHAIVTRIDELFAGIGEGEAALARARDDLGTWRKALLKAAVTGELTADWRAERERGGEKGGEPPTETGPALLTRLLAERRARWEAEPKNRGKRYKEPLTSDLDTLPPLPDGWTWATLGQLLDRIEAGLNVKGEGRPPGSDETGIVKISAVTWWHFDEQASKTLPAHHGHPDPWLIEDGDLLVSRANTLELVGAPAIVEGLSLRLMLSDKVLRLVLPEAFRRWVFYVMRSPFGRTWIEARSTGNQLSMRNISQDALRSFPVQLPPLAEMKHIVGLLDRASSQHDCTDAGVSDLDTAATTLRQSILAAAFRGELL